MSSTFGSFNTVRLGIYAAQKGLDVTGNNITNINTAGYTRQRLDQVSLITSASDRYYSPYKTRVGQGVLTTGVSQLRDPGLDIAYRNASADVGAADAKLAGLEKLASILDEVGKGDGEQDDGVLLNQLNDLRDLINKAITSGLDSTQEGLIRASAKADGAGEHPHLVGQHQAGVPLRGGRHGHAQRREPAGAALRAGQ